VLAMIPVLVLEQRRRRRYADASRELAWSDGPGGRGSGDRIAGVTLGVPSAAPDRGQTALHRGPTVNG
jgi:hypothetical protein